MVFRVSVDTGGTFTDVVVADEKGNLTIGKALTTRDRIFLGMKEAIEAAAKELGIGLQDLLDQSEMLTDCTAPKLESVAGRRNPKCKHSSRE